MKKPLAIALIIAVNLLLTIALGFAALWIAMIAVGFGIAIDLLLLAVHVSGATLMQGLFQKRGWLSPVKFWLCGSVPAAAVSAVSFGTVMYLDSINYFSGFFAGLGEFLMTISGLIYSVAFTVIFGTVLLIKYRQSKVLAAVTGFVALAGASLLAAVFCNLIFSIIIAAVYFVGAMLMQHNMEKKTGLSAFKFWTYSAVPATAVTGILYLIDTIVGGGYHIYSIIFVYILPTAVVLGAVLMIKSLIRRKSGGNASEIREEENK